MSYYERYKNGDLQVWNELCSLDSASLRQCKADAEDVARELVDRAYINLSLIKQRLVEEGYEFQNPKCALLEATANTIKQLDAMENQFGKLPLVVRSWYERLESVDFSQNKSQLEGEIIIRRKAPNVLGLGMNPVLVFLPPHKILSLRQDLLNEMADEYGTIDEEDISGEHNFLPTGGWAANCEPKGFWVPCEKIDDVLYNDGAGDVLFTTELRRAFEWGGFPFWSRYAKRPDKMGAAHPDLAKLLPLLTSGLKML